VALVLADAPLWCFAVTYVADLFVVALGLLYFYSRGERRLQNWQFEATVARQLIRDSWPLALSALAVTIYLRADQLMIKWMLGNEASGIYGVAVRLCEMWNFIPMAICASVFPAILSAKRASEELYAERLQQLYDLIVFISVGIALVLTLCSGLVVSLLFGEAYGSAGNVLSLYVWSTVFVFLGVANGKWIVSENLQMFRMFSIVIAGIMNVILNYFLIRKMGLNGAALATLVSYSFAGYFSFLLTARTRPVFWSMTRSFNPARLFGRMAGT
jgi:O-antigen/teichoic acid export membrane protein